MTIKIPRMLLIKTTQGNKHSAISQIKLRDTHIYRNIWKEIKEINKNISVKLKTKILSIEMLHIKTSKEKRSIMKQIKEK